MATIVYSNGTLKEIQPQNGVKFSSKELHNLVGGYIEIIRLSSQYFMVINEEGKLQNLPYNEKATQLYMGYVSPFDYIVGNAVVLSTQEID